MKQSRFTEERIIAILREHEAGSKIGDGSTGSAARRFSNGRAKYNGLDVSEARRLKILTDENAKLKKLLAEAILDNAMLKNLSSRKWERLPQSGKRWLTFVEV
jgi:putative transposase